MEGLPHLGLGRVSIVLPYCPPRRDDDLRLPQQGPDLPNHRSLDLAGPVRG